MLRARTMKIRSIVPIALATCDLSKTTQGKVSAHIVWPARFIRARVRTCRILESGHTSIWRVRAMHFDSKQCVRALTACFLVTVFTIPQSLFGQAAEHVVSSSELQKAAADA